MDRVEKITEKEITYYQIDVTNEAATNTIFANHSIDGVIHFTGLKAVGVSVEKPLVYYYNNIVSTVVLSKAYWKYGVKRFSFSSSATVQCYTDALKAERELGWTTKRDIFDMCRDAWRFEKNYRGYRINKKRNVHSTRRNDSTKLSE